MVVCHVLEQELIHLALKLVLVLDRKEEGDDDDREKPLLCIDRYLLKLRKESEF